MTRNGDTLKSYVDYANELFGAYPSDTGVLASNGFIVTKDNLHAQQPEKEYGYTDIYYEIKGKQNYEMIETIRKNKGRNKRLYLYDLGLIREKEVYEWFADLVNRQNNTGAVLVSPEGKRVISQQGRFCNKKGKRSIHIQKQFKEGIGEISDVILLSLTTHEKEISAIMPHNTNLNPQQWATVNLGNMIAKFLKSLRQYQARRALPWEYVGYTLEFQENGFPHVHMIFRGKWIGDIQEIAKLWPYCEPQGVDYTNKAKYKRQLRAQGKLKAGRKVSGIRLINYVTAYVSKCDKAVIKKNGKLYVHRGYAFMAFAGVRMYNIGSAYKKSKTDIPDEKEAGWSYEGIGIA